eukprot:scaffold1958_cov198-Alexandrium_tamarense.AAC.12
MNRSLLVEESDCDDGCTEEEDVVASELVKAMIAQRKSFCAAALDSSGSIPRVIICECFERIKATDSFLRVIDKLASAR